MCICCRDIELMQRKTQDFKSNLLPSEIFCEGRATTDEIYSQGVQHWLAYSV